MDKKLFAVILLVIFLVSYGIGIVTPLIPVYVSEMGASGFIVGAIFSGFSLSRLIFMPIVGSLSDRKGRKIFIITGLAGYTLMSLLYAWAVTPLQLVLIRILHGFFSAMVFPVVMAYVGDNAPVGDEGKIMGTFNTAVFLGMAAGPLLGGFIKDAFGMKQVFYMMTLLVGFGLILTIFMIPDYKNQRLSGNKDKNGSSTLFLYKTILKDKEMLSVFIFRISYAMTRAVILSFLPILANNAGLKSSEIGIMISLNVLFSSLFQRWFGKLADKVNKYRMILIGIILGAIFITLPPIWPNRVILYVISTVLGLIGAISIPAASAVAVKVGANYGMGLSMGIFNMGMSLGMIIAPVILGVIIDFAGINFAFVGAGILIFTNGIIFTYLLFDKIRK